jgi:hypothetical protein
VEDVDFRFGTPGCVGPVGVGSFFGAAALGAERLTGGFFFNLDGATLRTR